MTYDLTLKGGHVIDPKNQIDGIMDVGIKDRKIRAVSPKIPSTESSKTISVTGYYVTPGLIDIHVHVYGGYDGWMFPDVHSFTNGVTTVVDTGGAGWKSFEEFKNTIITKSQTRVLAFLNIVGAGMLGAVEQNISEMDPIPCAETVQKYPAYIVGIKTAHFGGPGWEAVDGAIQAGELSNTPVMIDFWPRPTRSYPHLLLEHMRPDDIHTHVYAQHIPILDSNGNIADYMLEARDRGILFDLGHGAGSFWWRVAVPAIKQGFLPDTISTDLHKRSALLPNANMLTTMSKCLNMGMSLKDVLMRSTAKPAQAIHRPKLGHLDINAEADIAVLDLQKGNFGFVDSGHARLQGNQKLQCIMTIRNGQIVWDPNGLSWPNWETAGEYTTINQ
ncbi:amidohydrolase/deacetylase family metallohydrolase [Candidatus Poribacteria bacterium]|nr:amidohydrolase/deacetylase family metallohydrolase [Candidatus Poribacteria bacterium]